MNIVYQFQISSGQGPEECEWVVGKLLNHLKSICSKGKIELKITEKQPANRQGSFKSVKGEVSGEAQSLIQFKKEWEGSILWIGESMFRPKHKRKNWFVGFEFFSQGKHIEQEVSYSDIHFQAIRSSGPGGQHVNKVSTAVRATHKPSGIQVHVEDTRSQYQNKQIAVERIKAVMLQQESRNKKQQQATQWMKHKTVERGNPSKTFEGSRFKVKS